MKRELDVRRQFGSDNYAGICPEAMAALAEANRGHVVSYGDDPWTEKAVELVRDVFETRCEVFFVFNGTAANSLALASLCRPYHSVLCHEHAHLETGECGAPAFFGHGLKLMLMSDADGKINPTGVEAAARSRTDVHHPKPGAVSVTQATEAGTVYSAAEVRAIAETAPRLGLRVPLERAPVANPVSPPG